MKAAYSIKNVNINIPMPKSVTGEEELLHAKIEIGEVNYTLEDVTIVELTAGIKDLIGATKEILSFVKQEKESSTATHRVPGSAFVF